MFKRKPVSVETLIRCPMDALWEATQDPQEHKEWDLRFTDIQYLPRESEEAPQRFLYTTRIGFGLTISGEGEAVGTHDKENGERTSSLKFWSDHPLSLIMEGSGYWKYIPHTEGITFLTWYDYRTRFGFLGKCFDRWVFRPILGWATAWSFDTLRLWLEKGIHPRISLRRSIAHYVTLWILVFIWVYQGLVPKVLFPDSGELELLRGIGFFKQSGEGMLTVIGLAEMSFGLLFLLLPRSRGLHLWNIFLLLSLGAGAIVSQPGVLVSPFNPVTFNLALISLSLNSIFHMKDLPFAGCCIRKQSRANKG